ncbi:hypothetical protein WA158_003049 [Blastocystis sp. Blastoise]
MSSVIVRPEDSFDATKLSLVKLDPIDNISERYDVYYKEKRLFIQTPALIAPFALKYFSDGFSSKLTLFMDNEDFNCLVKSIDDFVYMSLFPTAESRAVYMDFVMKKYPYSLDNSNCITCSSDNCSCLSVNRPSNLLYYIDSPLKSTPTKVMTINVPLKDSFVRLNTYDCELNLLTCFRNEKYSVMKFNETFLTPGSTIKVLFSVSVNYKIVNGNSRYFFNLYATQMMIIERGDQHYSTMPVCSIKP